MKVVLLQDIQSVGRKYDVKDVAEGYALNFLFPQKMAEMATTMALKKVEEMKQQAQAEKGIQEELLAKNMESLSNITIGIAEKINDKGHLFSSIHSEKLAEELKKQAQIDILPEFIDLKKPIKEAGEHNIEVKAKDKKGAFKLVVTGIKD